MLLPGDRIRLITFWSVVLFWSPITSTAHAESSNLGQTIEIREVTQGSLLFSTSQDDQYLPAPTLQTKVEISVTGLIVRAIVHQKFTNPGLEWAEGVYVFPLPETAAVDHLRMVIGDRRIEGMIQERTLAKKTYTAAKKKGQRASLLEQERPNIFTASVANIGPGEEVIIEIEYLESLRYDQGQFHLRFPMVVGPRYIPGTPLPLTNSTTAVHGDGWAFNTDQVLDASRITPPVQHPTQGPINPLSLRINLSAGVPLSRLTSLYHSITKAPNQEGGVTITLKDGEVSSDRDFVLIWEPQRGHATQAALFTETKEDAFYSLLMVLPPSANPVQQPSQPREVIFVIDTSGSMYGTSIDQAITAVIQALHRLTQQDRFNIIQFNNVTQALFPKAKTASQDNIRQAIRYVAGLIAEGGTEMLPALRRALSETEETNVLRQVIFITDGQIGNETELFKIVQQQLGQSRLFTIGIGSAPNSYFMRKAAEFGGGTFTYIGKITEVREQMNRLFSKLEHPALTHIQVRGSNLGTRDQIPARIPDLFIGEPIIAIKGPSLPKELTLIGQVGQSPWETTVSLGTAAQGSGIATYWARQKIESLMNEHTRSHNHELLRKEIIDFAFHHHLVSRYTSLVAVDITPVRSPAQSLHLHPLKTNLPNGQDYAAIFGMAQGATFGPVHIFLGLLCLILTFGLYRIDTKPE